MLQMEHYKSTMTTNQETKCPDPIKKENIRKSHKADKKIACRDENGYRCVNWALMGDQHRRPEIS